MKTAIRKFTTDALWLSGGIIAGYALGMWALSTMVVR